MASRQERMQQRLRGALRREVGDVDFGLVFPAAPKGNPQSLDPLPASQASLVQLETIKGSPVTSQLIPENQASLVPSSNTPQSSGELSSYATRTTNANTSKKRRTLVENEKLLASSRNSGLSLKESNIQNSQVSFDDPSSDIISNHTSPKLLDSVIDIDSLRKDDSMKTGKTPPRSQPIHLVTESPENAPGSGQRIIADESTLQISKVPSTSSNRKRHYGSTPYLPPKQRKDAIDSKSDNLTPLQDKQFETFPLHIDNLDGNELDELSSDRSLVQEVKANSKFRKINFDDNELDELSPDRSLLQYLKADGHSRVREIAPVELEEREITETIEDEQATKIFKMYQKQRNESFRLESPDLDLLITKPARKKQKQIEPKSDINSPCENIQKLLRSKREKNRTKSKSRTRTKCSIPIIVQRLTTPIINQNDCDDSGMLNVQIPTKPRGVNWIDVLMKVCEDIVCSKVSALKDRLHCEDTTSRREFKTKLRAVELFGKELQDQLLDCSLNLENAHLLERRLRDEQRKKVNLRGEILRVRAEREQVALKIDEVRKQHSEAQEENLKRLTLNNSIHNLELTMDIARDIGRGETSSHIINNSSSPNYASTQVLLKSVAHKVTNNSSICGLLMQVKDFNVFLERSALALERRLV